MTDAQIFQLIGIVYISVAIGIFTAREFYNKVASEFLNNPPVYYIGGLIAIVAGFLLVSFHNIWVKDWALIITIIGWIALLKGILLIALPKAMITFSRRFIGMTNIITVWAVVALILGALCCWLGFFVLNRPAI
ncbi:MAG: hypothetical protein ABFD79_09540 [Phycisphaerales bacterium]